MVLGTFSSFHTAGYTRDVQVVGNRAYVADDEKGMRVLDVSNPASITELGTFDTPGNAQGAVHVMGNLVYVADGNSGLRVYDVETGLAARALRGIKYTKR